MAGAAEKSLFGMLTEVDSIETLVLEGFDPKFIPSAELRPIYEWVIHQYRQSGNMSAPTAIMFKESEYPDNGGKSMADVLEEYDINLDDTPDESVEWVIEELRARHLTKRSGEWTKSLAETITKAPTSDRPRLFTEKVSELVGISMEIQTRRNAVEIGTDAHDIMSEYEARKASLGQFDGMRLGLPDVDRHTNGLHPGELMVIGAPPKTGKSYMIDRVALEEFRAGRSVALNTLENSIEMTRNRIACLATGANPNRFEMGQCTNEEEAAVRAWIEDELIPADNQLWILSPNVGARTAEHIVMEAKARSCDTLLIDQLTFMEAADTRAPRYLQIREMTHSVKTMISTGSNRMPCLMTHQLTRDGIKTARKNGYLHMEDMAEGSEVERTADWVLSMWQSEDARQVNQFLLQILASRRRDILNWDIHWNVLTGDMHVIGETELE